MTATVEIRSDWSDIQQQVWEHREGKFEALRSAASGVGVSLSPSSARDSMQYALAHHYTYALSAAVKEDRLDEAEALVEAWSASAERRSVEVLAGHSVSVASHSDSVRHDDQMYESPLYLSLDNRPSETPGEVEPARWRAAGELIEEAGLGWIVRTALGTVVTLDAKGHTETTESYALKALPGSIFIDTVEDPVRLGELVLHESSHALLNDVLDSFHVELSPEARWYSPWKGVLRPAYGILHAGFAFGVLQHYFEHFGRGSAKTSVYAKVRAETGVEQWDAARASVTDALQEVGCRPVERLLRTFAG